MDLAFPLLGLAGEKQRLKEALMKRESVLITGLAGAGKTALIDTIIAELPNTGDVVQVHYSSNLHRFLVTFARCLLAVKHRAFWGRARATGNIDKWLSQQTSVHLKGLLWTSLETEPRTIVLDDIDGASFPMYRFLQRLYFIRGMAFIAAARDPVSLGALSRLFWDPRTIIHVRPLSHCDSRHLFDMAATRFGLEQLDVDEFREKVLESAKGNPGQIVEMCKLAANPVYVSGKHIKFAPLRIDVMMRFLSASAGRAR